MTTIATDPAAVAAAEWTCACGQAYRITGANATLRLWPRSGNFAYSRQGIGSGCCCIRCGRRIALAH